MDYIKTRQRIVPHLLELLKKSDFNWSTVKMAAEKADCDYGLVRLAFKDSLNCVLETLAHDLNEQVTFVLNQEDLSPLRTHKKFAA